MADMPPMPASPPNAPPMDGGAPAFNPDTIVAELPEGDFSLKAMQRLADSINDAIPVLAPEVGEQKIEIPPEMKRGHQGKLPPQLAVPALVILTVAATIEPKYTMAASALVDDKALGKLSALIDTAAKDKAVIAAATGAESPPPKGKSKGAPMPKDDDTSEEVEMEEKVEVTEKAPPPGVAKYA